VAEQPCDVTAATQASTAIGVKPVPASASLDAQDVR
jgi:hypothetical protein